MAVPPERLLITGAELQPQLGKGSWIVFDCRHELTVPDRGAQWYGESHLPSAHFASVDQVLSGAVTGQNGRHPLPQPADLAAFLSRHGVTAASQVVAYDDAGGQYAARFWWLARWLGLTNFRVLDGGWSKWLAEGRPTTRDVPVPRRAEPLPARVDATQVLEAREVIAGLRKKAIVVLDARTPERYRGETEPIDPVAGRIPTARNRPYGLNLSGDKCFRPAEELRRDFAAVLGEWPSGQVVHQCGSGVTACANLFAMELAGLTGSRLYAGSWSEWIADPGRPIARGPLDANEAGLIGEA
ncbi:MAG: sulfurtransferase [Verrucomicrobia bacterium]|nr:sulfurtransferase [Verrucomicrobiota bacterium]